ncbi:rhodanese-like domain-containing protein [Vreelandella utahensis]|uniref:rhodanese-like domain-containing protein n=1 Tax=Vreelandella halophila TaxID=86177 RepID=UPI000984997D|nr:rhodanese-like domain-containing protein [Halomonas utahensis]
MRTSGSVKAVLMGLALMLTPVLAQAEPVWIDVRTKAEHRENHIDSDPLIPHTKIVSQVTEHFPDKDTEINLYCVAGTRAGKAKAALERAGYTNVKNQGGISDVRQARDL